MNQVLPRATLPELLERAVPYERWRAPLDSRLQILTWMAGAALLAHLLFLTFVPSGIEWSRSGFFLLLREPLHGMLAWMATHWTILILLNVLAIGIYVWLLWRTRGLQTGGLIWHRTAFGEVAAGVTGAFPLVATLLILILNFILWCVIIAAALWLFGVVLGALFSS